MDSMTVQLTLTAAAARTRQSPQQVEHALRTGDLRSLAPRDLDAWRRGLVARATVRRRDAR